MALTSNFLIFTRLLLAIAALSGFVFSGEKETAFRFAEEVCNSHVYVKFPDFWGIHIANEVVIY